MYHMMDWPGFPFYGFGMYFIWVIFIAIAFVVYQDATKQGQNGLLWFILVALPMIGIIFLLIYLVIRESSEVITPESGKALDVLNERYAKGEITREEYVRMKEDLEK